MRNRQALTFLAALSLAVAAGGDTVVLRDGREFSGKVAKLGETLTIEMPGTSITVEKDDVARVVADAQGEGAAAPPGAATPNASAPPARTPRAKRWNPDEATRPEPIVLMLARRLELLGGQTDTRLLQNQLKQWRILLHDGKRKVDNKWIPRDEQRRRRAEFEKRLTEAKSLAGQLRRYRHARTPADLAERRKLQTQAIQALRTAVMVWPDGLIREFLAGMLDLRAGNHLQAERRFSRCIQDQPLVAAFHQGRGMALMGSDQPLEALKEFTACLQLRDDTALALTLVEDGMKAAPGAKVHHPIYKKAKELASRYEKPRYASRRYGSVEEWLMPGRVWQVRDETLYVPPYDRIVSRQALGVPVMEDVLLVDAEAIADAEQIYVQIGPDEAARALPGRSSYRLRSEDAFPLAAIRVAGVTFAPVKADSPAPLSDGQEVTLRAVNRYRVMGTDIRVGSAKVTAATDEGVVLDRTLLPGESAGAVFVGDAFAGFVTGRCRAEEEGYGVSRFVKPADLADQIEQITRSMSSRRRHSSYRAPTLKPDAPKKAVPGKFFLVHALVGEKPPREFGK